MISSFLYITISGTQSDTLGFATDFNTTGKVSQVCDNNYSINSICVSTACTEYAMAFKFAQ